LAHDAWPHILNVGSSGGGVHSSMSTHVTLSLLNA
jgi:hypothetical protein